MIKPSKFQFNNPILKGILFEINENFDEDNYSGVKLSGKTKITKLRQKNKAKVAFKLSVGEKTPSCPFYIDIEMEAIFTWENNLEPNIVKKLLKVNAPSLLLGYMRPLISNITNSSQYPTFNIPFLDMQENEAIFEEE